MSISSQLRIRRPAQALVTGTIAENPQVLILVVDTYIRMYVEYMPNMRAHIGSHLDTPSVPHTDESHQRKTVVICSTT